MATTRRVGPRASPLALALPTPHAAPTAAGTATATAAAAPGTQLRGACERHVAGGANLKNGNAGQRGSGSYTIDTIDTAACIRVSLARASSTWLEGSSLFYYYRGACTAARLRRRVGGTALVPVHVTEFRCGRDGAPVPARSTVQYVRSSVTGGQLGLRSRSQWPSWAALRLHALSSAWSSRQSW